MLRCDGRSERRRGMSGAYWVSMARLWKTSTCIKVPSYERDGVFTTSDYLINMGFRTSQKTWQLALVSSFVRGIHRWPVDSHHKRANNAEKFACHDVSWNAVCTNAWCHQARMCLQYNDVTWAPWCLKSPACPVFVQEFVRTNIKQTSLLRMNGLCGGNPLVTGGFPSQKTSNAESVSIITL